MFTQERKYLFLIIVIFISACIETDIYLPAFTDMMAYFSISEETIQSLLSWNFAGICLSCPFYGPISDSLGRKKPLLIALGLFLLGSVMTLFAGEFYLILLGRVLQGLGSGGCFTLGTAILFDAFDEQKAIIALNKINTIIPVIMASAPILGGYLNHVYGFRSNFLVITISVLASFLITLILFEETLPFQKRIPLNWKKLTADFKCVALSLPFWQTTGIVSLIFAGYLAFLSTISVLYVIEFEVTKQDLPLYQIALLGSWLAANLCFKQCLAKLGLEKLKKLGTLLFVSGGVLLLLSSWFDQNNIYLFTIAMSLYSIGANWINSVYFPEGMQLFPEMKGITASLLTSARLLITACVIGITSSLYNSTIYPIAWMIFGLVVVILLTIIRYEKRVKGSVANMTETIITSH